MAFKDVFREPLILYAKLKAIVLIDQSDSRISTLPETNSQVFSPLASIHGTVKPRTSLQELKPLAPVA